VHVDALSRSLRRPANLTRLGVSAGLIVAAGFVAGVSVGARERAVRLKANPSVTPLLTGGSEALEELRQRGLFFPVPGAQSTRLADSFDEARAGGRRRHRAVDIMAPRHTPVRAVDHGVLVKLSRNAVGGLTLYQVDSAGRYGYFYAHLDRYVLGLREGRRVARGEILAYVGSSGNASPRAPHLHFAIHRLDGSGRRWTGDPLNPYLVLRAAD
jgi:peptidoglycan LD-endopeptidase LytH